MIFHALSFILLFLPLGVSCQAPGGVDAAVTSIQRLPPSLRPVSGARAP